MLRKRCFLVFGFLTVAICIGMVVVLFASSGGWTKIWVDTSKIEIAMNGEVKNPPNDMKHTVTYKIN